MRSRGSLAVCLSAGAVLCLAGGGCAALATWPLPGAAGRILPDPLDFGGDGDELELIRQRATAEGRRESFKPAPIRAGTVTFEVAFIERAADDPLLGPLLWDEIDQIGSLDREVRERLLGSGIRVGICGSRSPAALEKLLGEAPEIGGDGELSELSVRQQTLLSGGETVFEVGRPFGAVKLAAGRFGREPESLADGSAGLAMSVRASQPGWSELRFVPRLAFEDAERGYAATADAWRFAGGKRLRPFRDLAFKLSLGETEYAVIGPTGSRAGARERSAGGEVAEEAAARTFGDLLFGGEVAGEAVSRLLVIRVVASEPPAGRR